MKMRLDYELTNLINLGADEQAAMLALNSNMKNDNGAGTDVRLISIYNLLLQTHQGFQNQRQSGSKNTRPVNLAE